MSFRPTSLLAAVLFACSAPALAGENECQARNEPVGSKRYDHVFRKACHNCYQKEYAKTFLSALDATNNVEIDFYDTQDKVSGAKPRHWFVRHGWGTLFQSGNDNNCTGDGTGKNDLKACLGDVAAWSAAHPGHPVLTVFLDKKQDWGTDRQPKDLDKLIADVFPNNKIVRPKEIRGNARSLREAVENGAWPDMDALKNRIVFVMTGGQDLNHNKTQSEYVEKRGEDALIFVAPDADEESDVTGSPNQFSSSTAQWAVFYNVKDENSKVTEKARSKKYISRVWGETEDNKTYKKRLEQCVNFIALYKFTETGFNDGHMEGLLKREK
jgi:hypothetical protein